MHHSFETRIDYIALQEIVIEIDARKRDYQDWQPLEKLTLNFVEEKVKQKREIINTGSP